MISVDDRVLVYPVDKGNLSVVKSTSNYPHFRICQLVSLESWGYGGDSYKCADGIVQISHDYERGLNHCNVVWIIDSWNELDFTQFIEPAIRLASKKSKRIICSKKISAEERKFLSNIDVIYNELSSFEPEITVENRIQEIRTPVVFVMSNAEFCNQFFIETALCTELRNRNYNALLISSCKESIVFGDYSIPDFIFQNKYSENEKVLAINQFIRHLEMKHQPEVIIIGVCGVAMPFDHRYSNDFGIIAYELSESVKSDFTILVSPCMQYDQVYFKGIEKTLQGRLGVTVDIHSLAPYAIDFNETHINKCISYLSVDDNFVRDTIDRIGYKNLLNLNEQDGISIAVDRLIDKLSGNTSSLFT